MKRLTTLALLLCTCMLTHGQLLHIEAPADTALTNPAFLYSQLGMQRNIFNGGHVADYDNPDVKGLTRMVLFLGGYQTLYVVVEPGQTLNVVLTKNAETGLCDVRYTGKHAALSELNNALRLFAPGKSYAAEMKAGKTDTLSYEEAFAKLDRQRAELHQVAARIDDAELRAYNDHDIDDRYLQHCITLHLDRASRYGHAPLQEPALQQLVAQINPNDTTVSDQLRAKYLTAKYPIAVTDSMDVNTYVDTEIDVILRHITSPKLRTQLLQEMAQQVANAHSPELDVERHWARLQKEGGEEVTSPFQKLIDAKRNTAAGRPCPDFGFTDAKGTQHSISELFGRTLMIDVWATWCGPCKAEIPYLEKLVEAYKDDKRLLFVSISIDTDRQAWLDKIAADKPAWPQYHVAGEQYKALLESFGITGIPRFIIINPDGTIGQADAFRPSDEQFDAKMRPFLKD